MPTYEYVCPKCHHAFEAFQSMSDAPLSQCPKCKKRGLKRLIGGGAGLIFIRSRDGGTQIRLRQARRGGQVIFTHETTI